MHLPTLMVTLALLLSIGVYALAHSIALRTNNQREKLTPYECGFEPNRSARTPFSTRFFLLSVIFLVFDVEIILLFPLPILLCLTTPLISLYATSLFVIILTLALIHEWFEGALDWTE